jgi:LytS/YehU family sensor histidine kinase
VPQDAKVSDSEDITPHARRPPLVTIALLLVLALFVMRMFARAQQRAEQKADAAVAVADRETLQRQIVEARLQLLQAQVEPHFLFNTLAAVEHLIETAPPRAAQMQRHLIEYLRAALPRMRQQSATLGQEVELCVSYLKIMQMRMEERLQFEVAVPAGLSSASFPPMMIQSLVENSIRHGLEPKSEGGSVNLRAEVRDGKLCVTVEDTGMGFSTAAPAGIGLANIRERLHQLFGADAALTIEPGQPRGTRATITVPYAVA